MEKTLKCDVCGAVENLQRCGFCKRAYYCSRDHQAKDWKQHKEVCKKLQNSNPQPAQKQELRSQTDLSKPKTRDRIEELKTETGPHQKCRNDERCLGELTTHSKEPITTDKEEGMPFDDRSFKPCKTLTIQPSTTIEQTGKTAVDYLLKHGFCIIDGFFSKKGIEYALKDIHECERTGLLDSGRLEGGKTGDNAEKQVVNSGIRNDRIMWVEGNEETLAGISKIVSTMDEILGTFNIYLDGRYNINCRTKAMIACYPGDGSYYKRHVDNPKGDGRVVTCILYLNKDWNVKENGGFLRILPANTDEYFDVAPQANRLLFFWSDRRNPHEVHPAYRTRYAITVWYMDKDERERAKLEKDATSNTLNENKDVHDLEVTKKKQIEVNKQIEDVASSAISSLTIEELQVFGDMIKDHPNPREVLSGMGISSAIQDKLLQKLNTN